MASPQPSDPAFHEDEAEELITGEAVALDLRPTSLVLRAAGAMIDFVVYAGALYLLIMLVLNAALAAGLDDAILATIGLCIAVLCLVIAPLTVEMLSRGRSLGKLAVGARIVRDDGGALSFRHALIRALTGVFEIFMTLGGGAVLVALFNSRSKRFGDLLAGTYSQNERVSNVVTPVFGVPVPLREWAETADVAKLPDALARRVASFLAQAGGMTPESRDRLSRSLANEASVYVSPIPQVNAELFLAGVATLRRERELAALELQRRGLDRLAPVLDAVPRGFPDRG